MKNEFNLIRELKRIKKIFGVTTLFEVAVLNEKNEVVVLSARRYFDKQDYADSKKEDINNCSTYIG